MIYGEFASYYDNLFDNDLYKKWGKFVTDKVKSNQDILDLACGTGRLLVILKETGFNVSGADLSPEMLSIAQQHLDEAGFGETPLFEANMLDLSQLPTYGAVTCFDDSICYLDDLEAVQEMFEQVFEHLDNQGTFLFDVITPYQTDVLYPGYMFNSSDENHAFMWSSFAEDYPHSAVHELTFFDYDPKKDAFDKYEETHFERTYELADYKRALENSGFSDIEVFSDFGEKPISKNTTRWFFKATKK